ncbi:uncharacterized protein LOC141664728 [Apium graveolens]|uniref:uncharacterized protein LOC141664728 n=1 Tax=Apium graveolens TaxID=4045 RepID=UPI003D7C11C1
MFDESDTKNIREPQQDELVISLPVGNCLIKMILVDNGSAANIMMLSTLTQMGLAESDMIKRSTTLVGFSGETKRTLGEITLSTYAQGVNLLEKFCIIDVDSSYNIIMGRPWIHKVKTGNKTPVATVTWPEQLAEVDLTAGDKKKKNGKWRVCIDYIDLNKACPKYPYPLPHIDTMVDLTAGHELLTFLDASSGFNQIPMEPSDCEKTAFITDRGIYCYLVMPFGLRNVGATFQRLVNKMFKDQI